MVPGLQLKNEESKCVLTSGWRISNFRMSDVRYRMADVGYRIADVIDISRKKNERYVNI
jgi:hypothetical protein